jgi:hypothetical protein
LGSRDKKIMIWGYSEQKVNKNLSKKQVGYDYICLQSQLLWEAEAGGLWFEVGPGQICKILSEKITEVKNAVAIG